MAEFDNTTNQNPDNNSNDTNNVNDSIKEDNNQDQNNKVPKYTFWAEQNPNPGNYNSMNQGSPYRNNDFQNDYYQNNYQSNNYQNNNYQNNNQNSNYQNSNNQNSNYQNSNYQNSNYQNNNNQNSNNQNYDNQNNDNPNNNIYNINNPNNGYQNNPYQNKPYQNYSYSNNPYPNSAFQNYSPPEKSKKDRKPANKVVKFFAKAVCFGLIAGASFFGFQEIYYALNPEATSNVRISNNGDNDNSSYEIGFTQQGTIKAENKSVVSGVVKDTMPAIVSINCTSTETSEWFGQAYDEEAEGSGSGIIVGKDEMELLVATNNHVVEGANKITVTFADGTEAEAIVKGTDSTADLAVVTVDITLLTEDTLNAITVAKLGNSDDVKVGEMSIAIGNALGFGQSVTVGYVSAKDREVEVFDGYSAKVMILLQTDAAINPGNSGGALINVNGEVIGINTVKYASSEVEGMGYAIPISKATPIINDLMTREVLTEGEKGYLGIAGTDVTEEVASFYNMPIGVYIQEVSKGGAAEKSGLLPDDIITGADDLEISSISQLREYVNSLRVGTDVTITYMRNANGEYEEATLTVTLGQNPNLITN